MKRAKTLYTAGFEASKAHGFVVKCGKCRFMDGRREYERTMWYDKSTDDFVIILNGNAYPFKPYSARCHEYCDEWCPCCDTEVVIRSFGVSFCPNCGERILPCSMCDTDYNDCWHCPYDKD